MKYVNIIKKHPISFYGCIVFATIIILLILTKKYESDIFIAFVFGFITTAIILFLAVIYEFIDDNS